MNQAIFVDIQDVRNVRRTAHIGANLEHVSYLDHVGAAAERTGCFTEQVPKVVDLRASESRVRIIEDLDLQPSIDNCPISPFDTNSRRSRTSTLCNDDVGRSRSSRPTARWIRSFIERAYWTHAKRDIRRRQSGGSQSCYIEYQTIDTSGVIDDVIEGQWPSFRSALG